MNLVDDFQIFTAIIYEWSSIFLYIYFKIPFRFTKEATLVIKVGFVTNVGTCLVENRLWTITNQNTVANIVMYALTVIEVLIAKPFCMSIV